MKPLVIQHVKAAASSLGHNLGRRGLNKIGFIYNYLVDQYKDMEEELDVEIHDGFIVKGQNIHEVLSDRRLNLDENYVLNKYLIIHDKKLHEAIVKILKSAMVSHVKVRLRKIFLQHRRRIKEIVTKDAEVFNISSQPIDEKIVRLAKEGAKFTGAFIQNRDHFLHEYSLAFLRGIRALVGKMDGHWFPIESIRDNYQDVRSLVGSNTLEVMDRVEVAFNRNYAKVEARTNYKIRGGNQPDVDLKRMTLEPVAGIYIDRVDKGQITILVHVLYFHFFRSWSMSV